MKTLDKFLKTLDLNTLGSIVDENERYELLKYGLSAFDKLTSLKQVYICQIYAIIYR